MSFLSGIMKSVINPATLMQLAMGPAGWASIAAKAVMTAVAQQVIQQLGQQLGLPPAIINMAQQAFAQASGQPGIGKLNLGEVIGNLAQDFNLSPMQAGELQRAAEFDIQDIVKNMAAAAKEGNEKGDRVGSKGKGGSFMRRIAEAMAKAMDGKIEEMEGLAKKMDAVKHEKGKSDSTQINTDLTVATQEFSMMMQATANIIKTIGEGLSTAARKG